MIVLGKIKYEDRAALARLYHLPEWEVVVRVFGENEREVLHRSMESATKMEDIIFDQGQIAGVKKLIKGVQECGRSMEREGEEDVKENITTYNG
jgi:hypothetical protein